MNYDTSIDSDTRDAGSYGDRDAPHYYGETTDQRAGDSRRKWVILGIVAAIVVAAIIAFVVLRGGSGTAEDGIGSQAPAVSVIVPGATDVANIINATGTLTARRPMPVGSVGEGGEVAQVLVDAGDWVSAGQVLATVDRSVQSRQVEGQAAQVSVARADAKLAEANLQRALQLVDRGFISKADVDRLTATRDAAVARVRVAEAQLGELRARNARLSIRAPAAGLVLMRDVEPGQVVGGASGPLFVLARGGEMELSARVSESDLAQLAVGVPADVTPVGSGRTFTGQVWQLSPTIDESTRQGTARIALAYDEALRPGGFASVAIAAGQVSAPLLPESAIQSDDDGSFVFVVGDDNTVSRRPVETGLVSPRGIVIANGLTGSEKVVLRAGGFLTEGDKVEPRTVTAASGGAG